MLVLSRNSSVKTYGSPDNRVHIYSSEKKPLNGECPNLRGLPVFDIELSPEDPRFVAWTLPVSEEDQRIDAKTVLCRVKGVLIGCNGFDDEGNLLKYKVNEVSPNIKTYEFTVDTNNKLFITDENWQHPNLALILKAETPPSSEDEALGSSKSSGSLESSREETAL